MCWTTESYFTICAHWGSVTVETSCPRGTAARLRSGCNNSIVAGVTRYNALCPNCRKSEALSANCGIGRLGLANWAGKWGRGRVGAGRCAGTKGAVGEIKSTVDGQRNMRTNIIFCPRFHLLYLRQLVATSKRKQDQWRMNISFQAMSIKRWTCSSFVALFSIISPPI